MTLTRAWDWIRFALTEGPSQVFLRVHNDIGSLRVGRYSPHNRCAYTVSLLALPATLWLVEALGLNKNISTLKACSFRLLLTQIEFTDRKSHFFLKVALSLGNLY